MIHRNDTFTSNLIIKVPQLVSIMRNIEDNEFGDELCKLAKLTDYMFENTRSTNAHLNRIIVYTEVNCICKTIDAKRGFILLFNEGILSPAFSLNRLIFELWSAAHFVEKTLRDFRIDRDEVKFARIADKLFSGARYPVKLPWGDPSTEKPIHINEMLQELDRCYPGAGNTYSFLCEYCHPNFLYNMEAYLAGSLEGVWENPKFVESIAVTLEKQLSTLAQALSGIKASTKVISDMCLEEYGIDLPGLP